MKINPLSLKLGIDIRECVRLFQLRIFKLPIWVCPIQDNSCHTPGKASSGASIEGRLRVYTLSCVGIGGRYNVCSLYFCAYNVPPFHDQKVFLFIYFDIFEYLKTQTYFLKPPSYKSITTRTTNLFGILNGYRFCWYGILPITYLFTCAWVDKTEIS